MKGTIDAAVPNAAQLVLSDTKEISEHTSHSTISSRRT